MRRFALALVSALVALCVASAGAAADSSSNVVVSATVYSPSGNSTDAVTLAALQADPGRCPPYTAAPDFEELGRQGSVDVSLPPDGPQGGTWALSTVLGCLQTPVPVSAVQGITVLNAAGVPQSGATSELKPADLATPGQTDFNDPNETPVVEALGSLNQYDRPWRGSGLGQPDYDYLDEVQGSDSDQPAPISIEVFEGPLLTVSVTASRTTVPAGGTVTFGATVTGQGGSGLSYGWSFDGVAPSSTAATPQVTFAHEGQYTVTVQVTDTGGGGGVASIPITVGTPPTPATGGHHRKGAGTNRKSHSPTGPKKSGGNHAGGPAGKPKSGQSTTPTTGTNTTGGTASQPSATASTPATPAPSAPSTTTAAPHPTSTRRARPERTTVPRTRPTTPVALAGPRVTGLLISDVTPLPATISPLVRVAPASVATAPPARQAIRASLLPVFGAALAVVLLLGLGARRELRTRRDWRALRFGS